MTTYRVRVGPDDLPVTVEEAAGTLRAGIAGSFHEIDVAEIITGEYSLIVDGRCHTLGVVTARGASGTAGGWTLVLDGETYTVEVGGHSLGPPAGAGAVGPVRHTGEVRAPMPGLLVAVQAVEGAAVAIGQPLIIMEAMKMQMEIRAPHAGTVLRVHVAPGQEVAGGQLLMTID